MSHIHDVWMFLAQVAVPISDNLFSTKSHCSQVNQVSRSTLVIRRRPSPFYPFEVILNSKGESQSDEQDNAKIFDHLIIQLLNINAYSNSVYNQEKYEYLSNMCYCPLGCLKFIVGFGAIISIVISIALLVLTIYINVAQKGIITNASQGEINTALIILYVTSFVFMVLGICGLYGAIKNRKRKNSGNCLLGFYFIGVVVFFLLFVAGTVFFFVGPDAIFGTDCKQGSKTQLIHQLYQLNLQATSTLCSATCACYISNSNLNSSLTKILDTKGLTNYGDSSDNSKNYQECIDEENATQSNTLLMASLEEMLECGGWCPGDDSYYRFSDINSCVSDQCLSSKENCHDKFEYFMKDQGMYVGIGCGAASLVSFINLVTICCICYHPTKNKNKGAFYSKMMDEQ